MERLYIFLVGRRFTKMSTRHDTILNINDKNISEDPDYVGVDLSDGDYANSSFSKSLSLSNLHTPGQIHLKRNSNVLFDLPASNSRNPASHLSHNTNADTASSTFNSIDFHTQEHPSISKLSIPLSKPSNDKLSLGCNNNELQHANTSSNIKRRYPLRNSALSTSNSGESAEFNPDFVNSNCELIQEAKSSLPKRRRSFDQLNEPSIHGFPNIDFTVGLQTRKNNRIPSTMVSNFPKQTVLQDNSKYLSYFSVAHDYYLPNFAPIPSSYESSLRTNGCSKKSFQDADLVHNIEGLFIFMIFLIKKKKYCSFILLIILLMNNIVLILIKI